MSYAPPPSLCRRLLPAAETDRARAHSARQPLAEGSRYVCVPLSQHPRSTRPNPESVSHAYLTVRPPGLPETVHRPGIGALRDRIDHRCPGTARLRTRQCRRGRGSRHRADHQDAGLRHCPVVAAYADRFPRRSLLVGLNGVRAAVVLGLPFIDYVWQIYVLIAVLQMASAALLSPGMRTFCSFTISKTFAPVSKGRRRCTESSSRPTCSATKVQIRTSFGIHSTVTTQASAT